MTEPLSLRLIDPEQNASVLQFDYTDKGSYIIWHGHSGWNILKQTKKPKGPVVARLVFNNGTVYFETNVEHTLIRPLKVNDKQHVFELPPSTSKATHAVYLRIGDEVTFGDKGIKLEFRERPAAAHHANKPQEVSTPPHNTIEVRSSDPADVLAHHEPDQEQEQEQEVTRDPGVNPAQHTANTIPFSTAHEIIQETPNGKHTAALLPSTSSEYVSGIQSSPAAVINDSIAQSEIADIDQSDPDVITAMMIDDTGPSIVVPETAPATGPEALRLDHTRATEANTSDVKATGSEASTESESEQTPKPEHKNKAKSKAKTTRTRQAKRKSSPHRDAPASETRRSSKRHKANESPSPVAASRSDSHIGIDNPSILYSSTDITDRSALMKFMKTHSTQTANIAEADYLCVGSGPLKTTLKLLSCLIARKTIVTDKWVVASSKAGTLLGPEPFVPSELADTLLVDRTSLFAGKTIVFTPAARAGYGKTGLKDIETIIEEAGGTSMAFKDYCKPEFQNPDDSAAPAAAATDSQSSSWLVIGEGDDASARKVLSRAVPVYRRDIVSASVLHGRLMVDDDAMRLRVK